MNPFGILIVTIMFAVVMFPLLLHSIHMKKDYFEISKGIINYDPSLRESWYFSSKDPWQILQILELPGTYDTYTYCFNRSEMVLTLQDSLTGYTASCIVILEAKENGTRICLYWIQGSLPTMKAGTSLILYETLLCKDLLDAEPIPFDKQKM